MPESSEDRAVYFLTMCHLFLTEQLIILDKPDYIGSYAKSSSDLKRYRKGDLTIFAVLGSVLLFIHTYAIAFRGYGIFRDELYYLACAERPAAGYVDHPPLSVWLLSLLTPVFGDSWQFLRAIMIVTALATLFTIIRIIRRLEGSDLAVWIAGIALIMAPINNAYWSYYSMNALDLLFWALAYLQLLIVLEDMENNRKWLVLGVLIGLGMMNKISMSWFVMGMLAYLLITPNRKVFLTPGIYLAGIAAILLFLPFIVWNIRHDMAHLEFAVNASKYKYAGITRLDFLKEQIFNQHPIIIVLLVFSLWYVFRNSLKQSAPLIIFITTMIILLIKGQVQAYYMAPAYLAIYIYGGLQLSLLRDKKVTKYLIYLFLAGYVLVGLWIIPLSTPVLSEKRLLSRYGNIIASQENEEGKEKAALPQFFADMHGWEDFARTISDAYTRLDPVQREKAVAWVNNYGEAGAIEYYAPRMDLPPVLSRHNNYYLWGQELLKQRDFSIYIFVGGKRETYARYFEEVRSAGEFVCEYCMPYENHQSLYIGLRPRSQMNALEIFRAEKNYN